MRYLTCSLSAALEKCRVRSRVVASALIWLGLMSSLPGCVYSSNREAGTALGAGIGALTGAAIGEGSGHLFGGALIGALAGGITGGLIGNGEDLRQERDAALTHAAYLESTGQVLTNADVIRMVRNGLSDDVVVGTVMNSPGRYDLSADATIELKSYGTSDRVILAMQQVPPFRPVTRVQYVPAPRSYGVVVAPAPVFVYGRPRHYGPYYRHW